MADLITLDDARASLPALGIAQVNALSGAIAAASRACERYCGRALARDAFDEEFTPGTTRTIRLRNYPVAAVDRVCTDLSTALTVRALPGPWRATAALTADPGLALTLVGGPHAGATTLLFANLRSTADLAAAVSALPGWTATAAPALAACPPAEYRPVQGAIGALDADAAFAAYATDLNRWDLDERTGKLTLRQVRVDPYSYPGRTWGGDLRSAKVRVAYSAGFDPVPDDVAEACRLTLKTLLDARQVSGVYQSESLGNTSYTTRQTVKLPEIAMDLLAPWRARRL